MDKTTPVTSRRALLRALTAAPIAVSAVITTPSDEALVALHQHYDDEPATPLRSREGRKLSRVRYHRAESFFPGREPGLTYDWPQFLYRAGIAAQLGLSSHLLDVGFSDAWCARHIGLRVAKSLAYANATGLGHDCPDMARLATVLTPYWKWNQPRLFGEPDPEDGGFTVEQVRPLLRALLDRAHDVTGHRRPNGWRHEQREGRS